MMEEQSPAGAIARADWRNPKGYEPLLQLDRPGWATEFLKRNSAFVATLRLTRDRQPATPMPAKTRSLSAGIRFADAAGVRALEQWGALFRRSIRLVDRLVSRLQSIRVVRTGGANCARSPGRFRPLAFRAFDGGAML